MFLYILHINAHIEAFNKIIFRSGYIFRFFQQSSVNT